MLFLNSPQRESNRYSRSELSFLLKPINCSLVCYNSTLIDSTAISKVFVFIRKLRSAIFIFRISLEGYVQWSLALKWLNESLCSRWKLQLNKIMFLNERKQECKIFCTRFVRMLYEKATKKLLLCEGTWITIVPLFAESLSQKYLHWMLLVAHPTLEQLEKKQYKIFRGSYFPRMPWEEFDFKLELMGTREKVAVTVKSVPRIIASYKPAF